jgi:hypothetical protein
MTTSQLVVKLCCECIWRCIFLVLWLLCYLVVVVGCCECVFKLNEAEPLAETATTDDDPYISDLFLEQQDFVCHSS